MRLYRNFGPRYHLRDGAYNLAVYRTSRRIVARNRCEGLSKLSAWSTVRATVTSEAGQWITVVPQKPEWAQQSSPDRPPIRLEKMPMPRSATRREFGWPSIVRSVARFSNTCP